MAKTASPHASLQASRPGGRRPGELTGRMVLAMFLGFFGVVIAVNVVMARYAVSTFGGVETESSYKAGLAFRSEEDAAARQGALDWAVNVAIAPSDTSDRRLTVEVKDAAGRPLNGLEVRAEFSHPTDARQDVETTLVSLGQGRYGAEVQAHRGQWDLVLDLSQGGQRQFRSKNRIVMK